MGLESKTKNLSKTIIQGPVGSVKEIPNFLNYFLKSLPEFLQIKETSRQFRYERCWPRTHFTSRTGISGNTSRFIFTPSHCRSGCEHAKF